ncbi:MAG TPA: OmpH family outer membrane protein [Candidatus Sulfotelmatobacter sp.]|nr:OmpH family outer membrane protein [Candidatus Sulfotelmatobacter sp.]
MKSKFVRVLLAIAVTLTFSALAQTGSAATPSSAAAAPANPTTPATATTPITGTKIGAINIEGAIFGSNEGQKEVQALQKKFEPKQAELKQQNDELEALKKQLNTQGDKLNEDAASNLKKQIESKQKSFDRNVQDAQEEFGNQQQEIASKILQKMAPMIVNYARENGYGMIIDTSKPWPQSPILLAGDGVDITKPVLDMYNAQSGVAAPTPTPGAAKPVTPKSPSGASTLPKPTTPKSTEPSK